VGVSVVGAVVVGGISHAGCNQRLADQAGNVVGTGTARGARHGAEGQRGSAVQERAVSRQSGGAGNNGQLDCAVTLRRVHTTVNGGASKPLSGFDRGAVTSAPRTIDTGVDLGTRHRVPGDPLLGCGGEAHPQPSSVRL
jgi:hypothetical protein